MAATARTPRRLAGAVGSFVVRVAVLAVVSVLIGVCGGLLVLPVLGPPALAGKAVADQFNALPSVLVEPPLAQHSLLKDRAGDVLAVLHGAEDRVLVDRTQIPDVMKRAIVAVEDSRFYEHEGVDPRGLLRALVKNGQAGEAAQGGSTITQQYVKNVLLLSATTEQERTAATARSLSRKLQEARYAVELEKRLNADPAYQGQAKDEILSRYLNITFFGQGVYGVGLASQHYFGHGVESLTLSQAALLAGIVNSPSAYDPVAHPAASLQRRHEVLDRMLTLGLITADEEATADGDPVLPADTPAKTAIVASDPCADAGMFAFYCAQVRDTLAADPAFGPTPDDRLNRIYNGGLTITAAVDPVVQKAGQDAVDGVVERTNPVSATSVTVQPGTGQVLSIAINRTYGPGDKNTPGVTQIPLGTTDVFAGGSTFKAFVLVAALEKKLPLTTGFFSPGCYKSTKLDNPVATDPSKSSCPEGYTNAEVSEAGTFDMVTGTWYSVNTYFAQLEEKVGVLNAIKAATDMGVQPATVTGLGPKSGAFTLGAVTRGVSPVEMATAYATLADHGTRCDPVYVLAVTDSANSPVQTTQPAPCAAVMDAATADTVTGILRGVLTQPGATGTANGNIGRPAAGKTGTNNAQASAWFVGYTAQLSTAVALGNPLTPTKAMGTVEGVYPVFGGTLPELIWNRTMTAASAKLPVVDLAPAIASAGAFTAQQLAGAPKIPDILSLSPDVAQARLAALGYTVETSDTPVASAIATGFVAASDPAPGSPALPGSTVTLFLSTGVPPVAPPTTSPPTTKPEGQPGGIGPPQPSQEPPAASSPTVVAP